MTLSTTERVVVDTSVVSILSHPDDPRHSYYREKMKAFNLQYHSRLWKSVGLAHITVTGETRERERLRPI